MNWQAIRTWAMANLRIVFFGIGIILLLGFIFLGGSSNSDVPSVDFGALIISAALFWFANKVGTSSIGGKVIGTIAIIILIAGTYPIINYALNKVGLSPNFILVLAILMSIWVWKKGNGLFFWRLGLCLYLFAAVIGYRGGVIKDSFNAFLASTGVEFRVPDLQLPEIIKVAMGGLSGYAKHTTAQKISQSKERLVKNGSTFYNYDGTSFTKKDFSSKEEFIKVFILDEQVTKDGLAFEKVRIGDPATGEDAWVYSGILLTSPTATPPPVSKTEGSAPEWEVVKDCPIHFNGRIFSDTVGPDGERPCTGEVYSGCFLESGYDYKITFSGEYTKRLATQEHVVSWRGFAPQSQGMVKPFPNYAFGALILKIGDKEGMHPEADKDFLVFTPTADSKIFVEANVNREQEEYRDAKGGKLQNSTLSLKLERRPL